MGVGGSEKVQRQRTQKFERYTEGDWNTLVHLRYQGDFIVTTSVMKTSHRGEILDTRSGSWMWYESQRNSN